MCTLTSISLIGTYLLLRKTSHIKKLIREARGDLKWSLE